MVGDVERWEGVEMEEEVSRRESWRVEYQRGTAWDQWVLGCWAGGQENEGCGTWRWVCSTVGDKVLRWAGGARVAEICAVTVAGVSLACRPSTVAPSGAGPCRTISAVPVHSDVGNSSIRSPSHWIALGVDLVPAARVSVDPGA